MDEHNYCHGGSPCYKSMQGTPLSCWLEIISWLIFLSLEQSISVFNHHVQCLEVSGFMDIALEFRPTVGEFSFSFSQSLVIEYQLPDTSWLDCLTRLWHVYVISVSHIYNTRQTNKQHENKQNPNVVKQSGFPMSLREQQHVLQMGMYGPWKAHVITLWWPQYCTRVGVN